MGTLEALCSLVPFCKMLNPLLATTAATSILLGCLAPASAQSTNNGTGNSTTANLPIVDLGYELHQPSVCRASAWLQSLQSASAASCEPQPSADRSGEPHLPSSEPRLARNRHRVRPAVLARQDGIQPV